MNRQMDKTKRDAIVAHLLKNYTYDAKNGTIVNRRGRVVKGTPDSRGCTRTRIRLAGEHPTVKMHQMAWVLAYGRWPTQIDHINGNPRDNRIANLREVSAAENCENRLRPWRPNAKTGLPGVYRKTNGRYEITCNKPYKFSDQYEAFTTLTLLGCMFKD